MFQAARPPAALLVPHCLLMKLLDSRKIRCGLAVHSVLEVGSAADRALPLDRSGLAERQKPPIVRELPVSTIRGTCRRLSLVSSQCELKLKLGSGF